MKKYRYTVIPGHIYILRNAAELLFTHLSAVAGQTEVVALLHGWRHPVLVTGETHAARPAPAPPPPLYTGPAGPVTRAVVDEDINIGCLTAAA